MKNKNELKNLRNGFVKYFCLFLLLLAGTLQAENNLNQAICDINVLYLAGDAEAIDWASIYYLNSEQGCRVDIIKLNKRSGYEYVKTSIPDREIYLHKFYLQESDSDMFDRLTKELFSSRRPDIVLMGLSSDDNLYNTLKWYIINLEPSPSFQFNILKIYEQTTETGQDLVETRQVILNVNETAKTYQYRMRYELPSLGIKYVDYDNHNRPLVRYNLIYDQALEAGIGTGFLTNIPANRLESLFDQLATTGPKKITLKRQTRDFLSFLNSARRTSGGEQVEWILKGYRTLLDLTNVVTRDELYTSRTDLPFYFEELNRKVRDAAQKAVGINWDGKITLRDSPQGTKLKFRASLSANGPKEIELLSIRFYPYWQDNIITIDTQPRVVSTHQVYEREYLVDIDQQYLKAEQSDSLIFEAELKYGPIPITVRNTIPIWERPELDITFEPGFYFIPSPAELDIDRVISSRTIRAIITKPEDYIDTLNLEFITPKGLFAGAYNKRIILEKGMTHETIRIPYSISKLFEFGIQPLSLSLSKNNNILAIDTGIVRIASCNIKDVIKIGFVPDTTGLIEDILQMTDAGYRPFTDRGLLTAELDAYNVIVIGSGSFRNYPSLKKIKFRFEDYVRNGGSLVVFGQPDDWPEDMLPVVLSPVQEFVTKEEITNRIEQALILSQPYKISELNLFSSFFKKREVASAVVAPAEIVFVTPSGSALLSVSRIGEGHIIYCGLPLLELVSKLDIDAIHLFANILNY